MKRVISLILAVSCATTVLMGCINKDKINNKLYSKVEDLDFTFKVDPETFKVEVESNGVTEIVSEPLENMKVSDLKNNGDEVSWKYDEKNLNVDVKKQNNYLDISIKSTKDEDNKFSWPNVSGESYMLPLNQGKYIPSDDLVWKEYLNKSEMKVIESFSMQFLQQVRKIIRYYI